MGDKMKISEIDKKMVDNNQEEGSNCHWYDLNNDYICGSYCLDKFSRLKETDFVSQSVNTLKKHTSGLNISFKTNSSFIRIRAVVNGPAYMSHMTAVGTIGFDLYYKHEGKFVFLNTTKVNKSEYEVVFVENMEKTQREFKIYFPLYQGVKEAYVGVEEGCEFEFTKEQREKVVIYGTSISQGGCATRPGMGYSNILERMTKYEFINLGFSGSAHLENEMIDILNSIEKKYLILEVESNNSVDAMYKLLPGFVEKLVCDKIILISKFPNPMNLVLAAPKLAMEKNKELQNNIKNVIFIDGEELLKDLSYEETVDGAHLTDLGFFELAKRLKDYLKD